MSETKPASLTRHQKAGVHFDQDANGNQHKQEGSYTRIDGSANACTWRQAA